MEKTKKSRTGDSGGEEKDVMETRSDSGTGENIWAEDRRRKNRV